MKCIWQIFFICSMKSPQCTDKNSNTNISIAVFLPGVLMNQTRQISLPVRYKTARPKAGDREWLWRQDLKLCGKQISQSFSDCELANKFVFPPAETLSPEHNHSQSPVFGLAVLYPTGSEIWRFWLIKREGRKIAIEIFVLLFLSVHRGDFIEQIKKNLSYTDFNEIQN